MEIKTIPISKIKPNTGQIEGLPKNPRFIRDSRFEGIKKSIEDLPEMLEARELLVYPLKRSFVTIGGNMRLRACKDLGFKEMPCKVFPPDTAPEVLAEYAIKDNAAFGQDDADILANEWMDFALEDWGVNITGFDSQPEQAELKEENITPVEMAHFLISVNINNVDLILPVIQQIKDLQIAEIESNVN